MKKFVVILLVLAGLASVAGCILGLTAGRVFASDSIKGSGRIVSKSVAIPDFQAIDASRAVKVVLTDEPGDRVEIAADDNVIGLVTVEVKRNTLEVSVDQSVKNPSHVDITVTVPVRGKLTALSASSASQILAKPLLETDRMSIRTSSSGRIEVSVKGASCTAEASSGSRIEAALEVETFNTETSSGARIVLSGTAESGKADASSGSKIDAERLTATDLSVSASSGAEIRVCCTGTLHANASSGAAILYRGDCEVNGNRSSGGSIREI